MKWIYFGFLILFLLINSINASFNIIKRVKCILYECCEKPYVRQNFTKLHLDLDKYLYGQPLVRNTLESALKAHFTVSNPPKALVLSFHGSTGVGKNFVSQFVAEALFEKGFRSKFVKQFIATKDFPHNEKINTYKEKIKEVIEGTVKECQSSLFIFDETDKIPIGLMDTIKAYIDFNTELDGIDFRRAVFLFLSNSGAKNIAEQTLEMDKKYIDREDYELKPFQQVIENHVYFNKDQDNKGLWHASIIDKFLIDFYIPFLPLEKKHVKNCIKAEFSKYNFADKKKYEQNLEKNTNEIADQLVYEPVGFEKYSSSGCKKIPSLVRNYIVQKQYHLIDEL